MASKNLRPLHTFQLVEHFLVNALEYKLTPSNYSIIPKIVSTELNIENFDEQNITKNSKAYRNQYYRSDVERLELCKKVVAELCTKPRLEDDDKIKLGSGGILPNSKLQFKKQAYILIGLPASGKSTIANTVADKFGAIILDADYAKRKFPEFNALPFGASLIHEESIDIIFGSGKETGYNSVLENFGEYNASCVIPKIGSNVNGIIELVKILKIHEYEIHLTLVELDRKKATIRALHRFRKTKRYVPLALIFDSFSNNPTITYYRLKAYLSNDFKSFGILSTDVDIDDPPVKIESEIGNPASFYKK